MRHALVEHGLLRQGGNISHTGNWLGIARETVNRVRRRRGLDSLPRPQQDLVRNLASGLLTVEGESAHRYGRALAMAEREICQAALLQNKTRAEAARALSVHRNSIRNGGNRRAKA